jgi:hypothetical protein
MLLALTLSQALANPDQTTTDSGVRSFSLAENPYAVGAGVMIGNPTGLSVAWRQDEKVVIAGGLTWSVSTSSIGLHADYQRTLFSIDDPNAPNLKFPVYVGAGARFRTREKNRTNRANWALRVPLGIAVVPNNVPVDGFLEIAPTVEFWPDTGQLGVDAFIGARVFFG